MSRLNDIDGQYGSVIRTIFSVFITPPLIGLCLFFIVGYYNDQKQMAAQQNMILVELGKLNLTNSHIQKDVDDFTKQNEDQIRAVNAKCDYNGNEILEIWKFVSK